MKEKWNWFFLSFGGLVLGVLLTLTVLHLSPQLQMKITHTSRPSRQMQVWNDFNQSQKQMLEHFDRMFKDDLSDDFFKGQDPFENFKSFAGMDSSNMGVGELAQREDDKFVYFDLPVEDIKTTAIQSKIENGYLTVSGTVERKSNEEGFQKSYKSQFQRTFPLPQGIDTKKMEVVSEGHTVTFKFPKV